MTLWNFYTNYLSALDAEKEAIPFLRLFSAYANGAISPSIDIIFDLTVAAALYGIYVDVDTASPLIQIKKFLEKYNKMTKSFAHRHIYMPLAENMPSKKNLNEFISSITLSLEAASDYRPDLRSQLSWDLKEYFAKVLDMAQDILPEVAFSDFEAQAVTLNVITETIGVGGEAFSYDNVVVINPVNGLNQSFIQEHIYLTQISEDIFGFKHNSKAFIFFVPREITLCYSDCYNRYQKYYKDGVIISQADFPYLDHKTSIDNLDLNRASAVIATHRGINPADAEMRLRKWLTYIPTAAREPLILLIQAHETMAPDSLEAIIVAFDQSRGGKKNPFLIKRFRDYGGIHRILAIDAERARLLDEHGPDSIADAATEASLFLDVTVSGGQISDAINYYLSSSVAAIDKQYFGNTEEERLEIGKKLRALKSLKIFSVLWTRPSLIAIENAFRSHGVQVTVDLMTGVDVSEGALFSSTTSISSKHKLLLENFFADTALMDQLMNVVFSMNKHTRKYLKRKLLAHAQINLVTRYRSVTKKCLDFLTSDIKGYENSSIFERVREASEI
ncbi:hypothetical protein D3C81_764230 [compost metagenome]